jgi:DNA-binding ferritin-like protein
MLPEKYHAQEAPVDSRAKYGNNYKTPTNPMSNNLPSKTLREASTGQQAFKAATEKTMKDHDAAKTQHHKGPDDAIETSGDKGASEFLISLQQDEGRHIWMLRRYFP